VSSPPPLYLLDTGVLLVLVRGQAIGKHIERTYGLSRLPQRPLASVVSKAEIRSLAQRNGWGDAKRAVLENLLANVVIVDINTDDVINAYVEIDSFSHQLAGGARTMGKNDLWIAATARVTKARLLTTDTDFDHLDNAMITRDYIDPNGSYPP